MKYIQYLADICVWQHSVLERFWMKGSYLSQWLPQSERRPPKESKSRWNLPRWVPITIFFQTNNFFSATKKNCNTFCSVSYVLQRKKKYRVIRKGLIFFFQKSFSKLGPTAVDFNSMWFLLLHLVVVIGLGKNLLFKSVLGHCGITLGTSSFVTCLGLLSHFWTNKDYVAE